VKTVKTGTDLFNPEIMRKQKALIASNDLAVLIIDILVDENIVKKDDVEKAVKAASAC
jgi:hypothetical protein